MLGISQINFLEMAHTHFSPAIRKNNNDPAYAPQATKLFFSNNPFWDLHTRTSLSFTGSRHSKVYTRIALPPWVGPVLTVLAVQVRFVDRFDQLDWVYRVDSFLFGFGLFTFLPCLSDLSLIRTFRFMIVIGQRCCFSYTLKYMYIYDTGV